MTSTREMITAEVRLNVAGTLARLASTVTWPHTEVLDALSPESVEVLADLAELVSTVAESLQARDEAAAYAAEGRKDEPPDRAAMPADRARWLARTCTALLRAADFDDLGALT